MQTRLGGQSWVSTQHDDHFDYWFVAAHIAFKDSRFLGQQIPVVID
ncbi:MAG: hypothetical protein QW767_04185 [Thermoprotei archaeon]